MVRQQIDSKQGTEAKLFSHTHTLFKIYIEHALKNGKQECRHTNLHGLR